MRQQRIHSNIEWTLVALFIFNLVVAVSCTVASMEDSLGGLLWIFGIPILTTCTIFVAIITGRHCLGKYRHLKALAATLGSLWWILILVSSYFSKRFFWLVAEAHVFVTGVTPFESAHHQPHQRRDQDRHIIGSSYPRQCIDQYQDKKCKAVVTAKLTLGENDKITTSTNLETQSCEDTKIWGKKTAGDLATIEIELGRFADMQQLHYHDFDGTQHFRYNVFPGESSFLEGRVGDAWTLKNSHHGGCTVHFRVRSQEDPGRQ